MEQTVKQTHKALRVKSIWNWAYWWIPKKDKSVEFVVQFAVKRFYFLWRAFSRYFELCLIFTLVCSKIWSAVLTLESMAMYTCSETPNNYCDIHLKKMYNQVSLNRCYQSSKFWAKLGFHASTSITVSVTYLKKKKINFVQNVQHSSVTSKAMSWKIWLYTFITQLCFFYNEWWRSMAQPRTHAYFTDVVMTWKWVSEMSLGTRLSMT